jgi:hypothetical protein
MARAKNVVAIAADSGRGCKSVQAFLAAQPDGKTVQRFCVSSRRGSPDEPSGAIYLTHPFVRELLKQEGWLRH